MPAVAPESVLYGEDLSALVTNRGLLCRWWFGGNVQSDAVEFFFADREDVAAGVFNNSFPGEFVVGVEQDPWLCG